ncbi:HipA domain-containing protein [uncultured Alistipes sp.]|uniref:HipA domain-containing protein n=1 Tax=uncultured Alistipes sp. TaxID=538949 RepID=UPI0025F74FBD|nr:HipA domain-containing protein [uncultured Alistipes sp.]
MVFNYLIGNKNDHTKNFAFLYRDSGWYFAPAFDLLPSDGMNGFIHLNQRQHRADEKEEVQIAVTSKTELKKTKAEQIFKQINGHITERSTTYLFNRPL